MTTEKQNYTRDEVIALLNELLERPQILDDAINNEWTDYNGERLLEEADSFTDYDMVQDAKRFSEDARQKFIAFSFESKYDTVFIAAPTKEEAITFYESENKVIVSESSIDVSEVPPELYDEKDAFESEDGERRVTLSELIKDVTQTGWL